MKNTITLKPAHDRRVVDPATRKPLPADGADVERSVYWLRRLREGDVTEVKAAPQTAVKSAAKTK